MKGKNIENLVIENARIIFRNFSGKENKYNRKGNRNFCVIIDDPKTADLLLKDGWNLKSLTPRDPDDEISRYIQVAVSFKNSPPKIFMITHKKRVQLDENSIESLDYAEIKAADLIIRPYEWEVNGKTGVKGYLKTMYITIEEDVFAEKYDDDDADYLPF